MDLSRLSPHRRIIVPSSNASPPAATASRQVTCSPGSASLNTSGRLLNSQPSLDLTCNSSASEFGVTVSSEGSSTFFMGTSMMKYSARSQTLSVTLTANEGTGQLLRSTVVDVGAVSQLWNGCGGDSSSSQEEGNGNDDGSSPPPPPRMSTLLTLQSMGDAGARTKVHRRQSNPMESDATTSDDDTTDDDDGTTMYYKPYQSLDPGEESGGGPQSSGSSSSTTNESNCSFSPPHHQHQHQHCPTRAGGLASKIRLRARAASSPTLKSQYGDPMSGAAASPFSDAAYRCVSLHEADCIPQSTAGSRKQQHDPSWTTLLPPPARGGLPVQRPHARSPLDAGSDSDDAESDVPGICVPPMSAGMTNRDIEIDQPLVGARVSLKAALTAPHNDDANGPLQPD
jgi:hypothetical protein